MAWWSLSIAVLLFPKKVVIYNLLNILLYQLLGADDESTNILFPQLTKKEILPSWFYQFWVLGILFHTGEEQAWLKFWMPCYTGIWMGYPATPSQPQLAGGFPMKTRMFSHLGFWVVSHKVYLCLWFEYQDKVSLSGRWFPPLGSCGYWTSESCLLRSVSQAMGCNG